MHFRSQQNNTGLPYNMYIRRGNTANCFICLYWVNPSNIRPYLLSPIPKRSRDSQLWPRSGTSQKVMVFWLGKIDNLLVSPYHSYFNNFRMCINCNIAIHLLKFVFQFNDFAFLNVVLCILFCTLSTARRDTGIKAPSLIIWFFCRVKCAFLSHAHSHHIPLFSLEFIQNVRLSVHVSITLLFRNNFT